MTAGDKLNWHKVVSNYGHIAIIPVTVVKVGKRITVDVPLKSGGTRRVSVTRERLRP